MNGDFFKAYFTGLFLGALICFMLGIMMMQCSKTNVKTEHHIDTLIVHDTIRDTLLVPRHVYISRIDTVFLRSAADTVYREVLVPIEQKEYRTDDYFAVVEGYRPKLLKMEVYPETKYITDHRSTTIKKKPAFGCGVQAGYGFGPRGPGPYIGVGLQYNIITF